MPPWDDGDRDADLQSACAGDEAAFARVYRSCQPALLRYVTTLAGPEAEDVCAEAWAQACRDLATFRGGADDFRAWLARIARNRAIDSHRARARRPAVPLPPEEMPETISADGGEDAALVALSTADAIAAIAALPPDQAEAVMVRVVLGLDAARAGTVLGKRAGAVRTASYRGLKKLAENYGDR